MTWPSVSVIIPSYNQGRYIERTLLSILRQGYPGPLQVVVADGGSTDETVAVLRRYPQVRWWSERDRGFVDAVTRGLAAATGEVVAIQSSDDYYLEGAFARAISVLQADGALDFVTGNEIRIDEDGQVLYPPPMPWVTLLSPGALIGRNAVYIPQHCTFARRSAVDRVGGLREAVDMCADFDLWYRLLHFGRGVLLPDYLAAYQVHLTQRSQSNADLWLKALEKVVEDAEQDPLYARHFLPSPDIKRGAFLLQQITWNQMAGGEEGVVRSRVLAEEALRQPDQWPDYVLDFIRGFLPPPPPPPPLPPPLARRIARALVRKVKQNPGVRAMFGRSSSIRSGPERVEVAVPVKAEEPIKIEAPVEEPAAPRVDIDWWRDGRRATTPKPISEALRSDAADHRQRTSMPQPLQEERSAEWNRYLKQRVESPLRPEGVLRPETLRSVFIIVPGSSGDVVLATTVVRYIKDRNPGCHVTFAVKRSNLYLPKMCPGIDKIVEWPRETPANPRGRQRSLAMYADKADVVIYPISDPEDMDLLLRFNFLETIWLLSGIPDGLPREAQQLWMTPPDDPDTAARVLERCLSRDYASHLFAEAGRRPGVFLRKVLRERQVRNAGWKILPKASLSLLRHASYVRQLSQKPASQDAGQRFAIVSSEANAFPAPAAGLFEEIIRFLRSRGRVVLHNVLNPADAAPGTVPLVCSYHEFLCLRELGVPFIGWRSGLCDIAAVSSAPMCAIYPSTMQGSPLIMQVYCETGLKSFGFASMNIATNCLEMVCDSVADLSLEKLAAILE